MAINVYPPVSGGGGVSSVTGTAPVVSSGGSTPAISIPQATGSVDGYISATDWNTFNNKAASGANTDITSVALTSGTVSSAPSIGNDIVNKTYVDTIAVQSVHYHQAVKYELAATNVAVTYNNGSSGVGATLTNAGTLAAFAPDGTIASVGDRILVYRQNSNQFQNGIYTVTTVGSGSVAWVLTRATDANTYDPISPNGLGGGDAFFITSGNTGAGETYVCSNTGVIVFGTTAITFSQISDTQIYSAGTGLTLSGTQFSITDTGTAGTYGSASLIPVITTNAQGQVTSVTTASNPQGTVTSVAALTLGTTGTDLSSTVATGTTTPVITLNVPTASATNRGALSSTDWSTFNGKQATLVSGTNIKTINGSSVLGSGDLTVSASLAKSTAVYTTGTAQTYTAPANTQWVKVTVVGPGGNGGASATGRATGGGGGGVAYKWLSMTAGQTLTYTVGTASGTASTVSSGTLVITTISAGSGANGTATAYAASQTAGGAGGTTTGGDINITGGQGGYSYGSSTTITTNFSGKGGDCPGFGSGGPALAFIATAGVQGNGYGAGGGGAIGNATTAAGRGGIIIFEAY